MTLCVTLCCRNLESDWKIAKVGSSVTCLTSELALLMFAGVNCYVTLILIVMLSQVRKLF